MYWYANLTPLNFWFGRKGENYGDTDGSHTRYYDLQLENLSEFDRSTLTSFQFGAARVDEIT
jgi:hypothetical protein